jgi:hypothetical protein
VGFSVQQQHIAKLPVFAPRDDWQTPITFIVPDTIEGWADALQALLDGAVAGRQVLFDFSLIRREGAPLRTSGRTGAWLGAALSLADPHRDHREGCRGPPPAVDRGL